jgi:hypothetical protein
VLVHFQLLNACIAQSAGLACIETDLLANLRHGFDSEDDTVYKNTTILQTPFAATAFEIGGGSWDTTINRPVLGAPGTRRISAAPTGRPSSALLDRESLLTGRSSLGGELPARSARHGQRGDPGCSGKTNRLGRHPYRRRHSRTIPANGECAMQAQL